MFTSAVLRLMVASALLFSFSATAEELDMAPGLWEITTKNPELEKAMANLPPEVRKKMGLGTGVKVCMTKAQIARGYEGQGNLGDNSCKVTDVKRSGNKVTVKTKCSGEYKADITSQMTHASNKAWTSVMETKSAQGSVMSNSVGKWLKSDCGNVKPLS